MKLESEGDATEWIRAAKALAVVSAWNGLGWFERMKEGPIALDQLGGDPRAIATTLPVLLHLGLVASDGQRVGLTPACERLLERHELPTPNSLDQLGDLSRTMSVLTQGGPVRDAEGKSKGTQGGTRADDLAHTERFLEMLYRSSKESAKSTFEWLSPALPASGSVLDLGGGHGRYGRTFAEAGYKATLFDLPHVIAIAKKRHGDALDYREGNFHDTAEFGGPYDLVLLSNIVHGESAEQNASLIGRLAKAVRPGGYVVLKDMFIDEHGQDPANAVFFGLTMLFYTEHGSSPTLCHARQWFERAGLEGLEVTLLGSHQLVRARKPKKR